MDRLRSILRRIDGRGYKAYKELKGRYDFDAFTLEVDHVQGDPFALPSRITVTVPATRTQLPEALYRTAVRRIALEDGLSRAVASALARHTRGRRGSGKGGLFTIATSGQQVLERNALLVARGQVEARLTIGLPADGRRILGRDAEAMLLEELPRVVDHSLTHPRLPVAQLLRHVESVEDQEFLRTWLSRNDLVAFVADGAVLPRASGIDDRPMAGGAVPFRAPDALARTVELPNAGAVRGLGIAAGVTLIVGGGFHGKSTLLHALERGVYNHIPGDGRERVATEGSAVKIRAEDGRAVHRVNISPFINNLPLQRDTTCFSTENASGSTSQAANILEALECGAKLLLIDEDTSATNFMIRDARMQQLVSGDKEPITPLLHRVRELYERHGVSSVIVMGGSGDYLEAADTVLMLDCYRLLDVTAEAARISGPSGLQGSAAHLPPITPGAPRPLPAAAHHPARGRREVKIDTRGRDTILFGDHLIDLGRVEQLVDIGQTQTIGLLIHACASAPDASRQGIVAGLNTIFNQVQRDGLDALCSYRRGDLALPRLYETAAAANRFRSRS